MHREESEKVSELKIVSGSNKLPYGTLALGAEGIKDAINTFEDAYVVIQPRSLGPSNKHCLQAASQTLRMNGFHPNSSMPTPRKPGS